MEIKEYEIRLADDADSGQWDKYISNEFTSYPPLSCFAWKEILERSYKVKTYFFILLDESKMIRGICPTYVIRDIKRKKHLFSLKFGLCGDNNEIKEKLYLNINDFCRKHSIVTSSITSGFDKIYPEIPEKHKKTLILDLADSEEKTWNSLRDKTRNMIRKANKSGLIAESGFHNLKDFYNIYLRNMLYKGVPIHSYNLFLGISEKMKNASELIVAKRQDKIIAGILILYSKAIATYPFQSALMDTRKYAPNQFLVWEAMKSCIQKKVYVLDMGEASENGDVYRFKINFGGKPKEIYYYNLFQSKKTQGLKEGVSSKKNRMITKHFSFSILNKIIFEYSPFWLKKKMGLWLKTKARII